MQTRGLLAATVLLAVLGLGVYFSNRAKQEEEKKGTTSKDAPKILSIPEDQFQQIEIRKKDGVNTVLKKGDKWEITAPEKLAVDQDAVNSLVSALSNLNSDRLVDENNADWAGFGLQQPQLAVVVTKKDGKTSTLQIGDETATAGAFFARLNGENKLYTVGSFVKTSLDKGAQDLRDKRLIAFDSEKVTRVEVTAKNQTVEFGKNAQNEWQIVKPKPLRADNWAVEELVRKIKDAKMDPTVKEEDRKKTAGSFEHGTRVALAKVTDAAGTHEIEIRKFDKDFFAKGSAASGSHKVTAELGEGVDKALDDFRNKKPFEFGFSEPSKLEVKDKGATKSYQKQGEKWMLAGQEMDSVSVQSFVDKLRDLSATKFLETGFKEPIFEVTVTAKEGKLQDHVLFSKDGDKYYGIREKEPTVYQIDAAAFGDLQKAAGDVKPPAPPKKDEKKK